MSQLAMQDGALLVCDGALSTECCEPGGDPIPFCPDLPGPCLVSYFAAINGIEIDLTCPTFVCHSQHSDSGEIFFFSPQLGWVGVGMPVTPCDDPGDPFFCRCTWNSFGINCVLIGGFAHFVSRTNIIVSCVGFPQDTYTVTIRHAKQLVAEDLCQTGSYSFLDVIIETPGDPSNVSVSNPGTVTVS